MKWCPIPLAAAMALMIDIDFEVTSSEDVGALSDCDADKDYVPDEAPRGTMCVPKHHSQSATERKRFYCPECDEGLC